jgi:lipoprotein-anchoring transpeptidase ErfK/SrfK
MECPGSTCIGPRDVDSSAVAASLRLLILSAGLLVLASCAQRDRDHHVIVSIPDQRMVVYQKGQELCRYDVSTSKFGLGDRPHSCATPLGHMEIAKKIGDGAPLGMKFKDRRPTGEIVVPDAPGRDPIVTRILWLKGLDASNQHAFDRTIYIHGTAEERKIGTPASYGCVRMRSRDVLHLFNTVGVGARVDITTAPLPPMPSPVFQQNGVAAASPTAG